MYIPKRYGQVLTEHIGDNNISVIGEDNLTDVQIYDRDSSWISSCDAVIAEVSSPSLGVGYEIGFAEMSDKPVLCLYDVDSNFQLSAMISGNSNVKVKCYKDLAEAKLTIRKFISGLDSHT